jgi:hypothetical protein
VRGSQNNPKTMLNIIQNTSRNIQNNRTRTNVLIKTLEELGEVSVEVQIAEGNSYKTPSNDGVVGEAIDAVIALIDLIYVHDPNISASDIEEIVRLKCQKWQDKAGIIGDMK